MKRILITGKNSYIGNAFEDWISQWPNNYEVTKWDFRDDSWRERDFSQFDSIFNVAGIAHNSSDKKLEDLYYKVNRDLAIEIAKKAKSDGVKQYIHMSSIIVYGSKVNRITAETPLNPDNFYGDSKVQAEFGINEIADESFKVAIIRPPMIYGENSKGNYPVLASFAKKTPIFPDINNCRSMLYIDNLCELVRLIVDRGEKGIYYPQMEKYISSTKLVKQISEITGHRIFFTNSFNYILKKMRLLNIVEKVFGDLFYSQELSNHFNGDYRVVNLENSIVKTENGEY